MDDYSVHIDNDLYKKFDVLSKDFKENIDKLVCYVLLFSRKVVCLMTL